MHKLLNGASDWFTWDDLKIDLEEIKQALGDEAQAESAEGRPDPTPNAPRLTLDRPPFDGTDIMRLNHLAEQFPQYEQSTRWKNLGPLIDWAIEVRPVPRGGE